MEPGTRNKTGRQNEGRMRTACDAKVLELASSPQSNAEGAVHSTDGSVVYTVLSSGGYPVCSNGDTSTLVRLKLL